MKEDLWEKIVSDTELQDLEQEGFRRGERKRKTMDISIEEIHSSLKKQFADVENAYLHGCTDKEELKKCLADLRNVAGCLFLKLKEGCK